MTQHLTHCSLWRENQLTEHVLERQPSFLNIEYTPGKVPDFLLTLAHWFFSANEAESVASPSYRWGCFWGCSMTFPCHKVIYCSWRTRKLVLYWSLSDLVNLMPYCVFWGSDEHSLVRDRIQLFCDKQNPIILDYWDPNPRQTLTPTPGLNLHFWEYFSCCLLAWVTQTVRWGDLFLQIIS
jgi:hypothetical protein